MAEQSSKRERWLVAAWPGMGTVSIGAAAYLINTLGARFVHELRSRDIFELTHVEVKEGLARPGQMPRSVFFEWTNPNADRDLLIFLGEAQPPARGYALCHTVLDYAQARGVDRVFTFAAMATQLHPSNAPNVFGVATNGEAIRELQNLEVTILKEGQITGLNGVLLAAAIDRGIPATCLMGELPYFATAVPNPGASQAVLEVFTTLANIEIDFAQLKEQAQAVEDALLKMLEKLQDTARQQEAAGEEAFTVPEFAIDESDDEADDDEPDKAEDEAETQKPDSPPSLNFQARQRVEALFKAASQDRNKAFELKAELDRLGVFEQYEDRFLDLFKRAE